MEQKYNKIPTNGNNDDEFLRHLKNNFFEKPSDYIEHLNSPPIVEYFKKVEGIFFEKTDLLQAQMERIATQIKSHGANVPQYLKDRYTFYWDLYNTNATMIKALIMVLREDMFMLNMCIAEVDSLHANEKIIKHFIEKNLPKNEKE